MVGSWSAVGGICWWRVVKGGSLARFTNRKNSKSRITEMKISCSSSSRVMQNLQVTDYEE